MGVDAELYAAAAAFQVHSEPQRDAKETSAHNGGSTVAGGNLAQNGIVNLGTRQEGVFVCEFICAVEELE